MEPALERRPATEAVAMMEPEGYGLEGEVRCMAREACLDARKTLDQGCLSEARDFMGRFGRLTHGETCMYIPQNIRPQSLDEVLGLNIPKQPVRSHNRRICKEDVQTTVFLQGLIDDSFHGLLI